MVSSLMLRAIVLHALFNHAFADTSSFASPGGSSLIVPSAPSSFTRVIASSIISSGPSSFSNTDSSSISPSQSTFSSVPISPVQSSFPSTLSSDASGPVVSTASTFSSVESSPVTSSAPPTFSSVVSISGTSSVLSTLVSDISSPVTSSALSTISSVVTSPFISSTTSSSDVVSSPATSSTPSSTDIVVSAISSLSSIIPSPSSNTSSIFSSDIASSTSPDGSSSPASTVVSLTSPNGSSAPTSSIDSATSSPPNKNSDPAPSSTPPQTSSFPTPPAVVVISAEDVGPITLGPQTSTETGPFTSKQTGIDGLTANSATTTSTDGHNTILPIWFLSDSIGVIQLPGPGADIGGIVPPPPGFPPLFIGSDGGPTAGGPPKGSKDPQTSSKDSPNSDSPTTTEPTTTNPTSTDATTTDSATTDTTSASTISSTSSSSSSASACSTGCSSCYTYGGDGETVAEDTGGDDNALKRSQPTPPPSIAGRIPLLHLFDKRAENFDKFENPNTGDTCTLSKGVIIPGYPSPGKLRNKVSAGAQLWFVMTETTAPNTCPVLDYKMVSDADVTSQKINIADVNPYSIGKDWKRIEPSVNVDHVYELSILKQYFQSRVTAANCNDFKAIFEVVDTGSPLVSGDTRLQTIWRQLPSNINPDFAGMDAQINRIKAQFFSNKFSNPSGSDNSLGYLYQLAIAMKLTNDPLVSPLFGKANNRIYAALLAMDAIIAADCNSGTIQADWASSYETFMINLLTTAGTNVNDKVSSILNNNNQLGPSARVGPGSTTGADGQATATTNSIGNGVAAFLNAYPTPGSFTLNVGNLVSFPSSSTANIKRQACTKPPLSTSPTPSPTSAPPSSVQTSMSLSLSGSEQSDSSTPPVPMSSQPSATTIVTLITPPPASSSAPALPGTCPEGCQCFTAPQGGCDCLCS